MIIFTIFLTFLLLKKSTIDKKYSCHSTGAPFGTVRIGIARPLVDDNYEGQVMMGQLRERLAENETIMTASTTTDVSFTLPDHCATGCSIGST